MNTAERNARDAKIEAYYRQGISQAEIGRRTGVLRPRVHLILKSRGLLDIAIHRANPSTASTMWDRAQSNDQLREAIYRRQRQGAREALRAMQQ